MASHASANNAAKYWCVREADMTLAAAILEKERLLVGGSRHDKVMAQDAVIERCLTVSLNTRAMNDHQLALEGTA